VTQALEGGFENIRPGGWGTFTIDLSSCFGVIAWRGTHLLDNLLLIGIPALVTRLVILGPGL
jgi:hypothetical protein